MGGTGLRETRAGTAEPLVSQVRADGKQGEPHVDS
jgi:hypothetical protein